MASLTKTLGRQIGLSPPDRTAKQPRSPVRPRFRPKSKPKSKAEASPCARPADASKVGKLLNEFVQAASAVEIVRIFDEVVELAGVGPGREVDLLTALTASFEHALQADGSHRPRQLFAALAERRAKPQYDESVPACRGLCAVVLGGGPIGLRAAIELARCDVSSDALHPLVSPCTPLHTLAHCTPLQPPFKTPHTPFNPLTPAYTLALTPLRSYTP